MDEDELERETTSVSVTGAADADADEDSVSQMLKSKEFYFQQRRGRLDLRAIAQVDLEMLVKEVDIDVLQAFLENITFSNLREDDLRYLTDPLVIKLFRISQMTIEYLLYAQEQLSCNLQTIAKKYSSSKKSLSRKRKELLELQETAKHLKGEVKSKKKGICTLEALLKDASRTRGTTERAKVSKITSEPVERPKDDFVRFFVTFNDGLCVEFTKRGGTKIWELRADVKKAFISRRDEDTTFGDIDIRLRGISLQDDTTLTDNNIVIGDTITAHISQKPIEIPAPVSGDHLSEAYVEEMIKKQQDALSQVSIEIRKGMQEVIQAMNMNIQAPAAATTTPVSNDPKYDIDSKLCQMEDRVRLQLEFQMESMQQKLRDMTSSETKPAQTTGQYVIQPGELESDDEDVVMQQPVDDGRFERLALMLASQGSIIDRQEKDIEDLRSMLLARPEPVTVIKTVQQPVQQPAPPPKSDKWKELTDAVKKAPKVKIVEPEPAPVRVNRSPSPVVEAVAEAKKEKIAKAATSPPEEKIQIPLEDIIAVFTSEYNADLDTYGKSAVKITLSREDTVDDLIFHLRQGLASSLGIQMSKIALVLDNRVITLGVDLKEPLDAEDLGGLALQGKLTFTTSKSVPMTDAQLDFLVTEWENKFKGAGMEGQKQAMRNSKEFKNTEKSLRRSLGESKVSLTDAHEDEYVLNLRGSLDDALDYMSEREGLTDDELNEQYEILKIHTESLSTDWSDHLNQHRNRIVAAMPAALASDADWGVSNGEPSKEPKLKLLRASSSSIRADSLDAPLMGSLDRSADRAGGKGRYQVSASMDSNDEDYPPRRGPADQTKSSAAGRRDREASDYEDAYEDKGYVDETSELDMSKTVDSDFTVTRAEMKRDGVVDIDAVRRRADEYEKKASSPSDFRGRMDNSTPTSSRPKGPDSNYSKSSSLSNMSPFGTLQTIADDEVHEFVEEENIDGSLALSESFGNDMSFASV